MALWRVGQDGVERVSQSGLEKEGILEEKLEDWVVESPDFLGEPLLVIGRQVVIPDIKDRLDVLALDPQGNTVVIELKRGTLTDPVDIQALRYASYVSKWGFEDLENQAASYLAPTGGEFNFNELFEGFCSEQGVDETPDLNVDQRVIVVGTEVRDRLGSVALWLREHGVDISVIEVDVFRDGETLFAEPRKIIPLPVSRFVDVGRVATPGESRRPWLADGRTWHLEKRCSQTSRAMLMQLDTLLQEALEVDPPSWKQKFYAAYKVENRVWLAINTGPRMLGLNFSVAAGTFAQEELVEELGVVAYDTAETLAEKFALPSSVVIEHQNNLVDKVILRVKEGFDLDSAGFRSFLSKAFEAFPWSD